MKVYTRTGDSGTTSLVGGARVSKASPRLEAYGTADELNAHLGLLLAMDLPTEARTLLTLAQHRLFNIGAQLATEPESAYQPKGVSQADVEALERGIDQALELLPKQFRFVLPGGTMAAAQANVARTVARRCERRMVEMADQGMPVAPEALRYVNRLSDYLFVLGRQLNLLSETPETYWDSNA